MSLTEIVASIDREIAVLRQARQMLAGAGVPVRAQRGRPAAAVPVKAAKRKRNRLSPEGRRRIAEAVRRRWEAERKAKATTAKVAAR